MSPSGSFDVSTLNAIAKGADIKYVSDKGYLDPTGCSAMTFVVRKELMENGSIKDPEKLKNMKVALMPASSSEYGLDMLLKEVGITTKDMDIQNVPLPSRLEAMKNGSLDITAVSEPWTTRFAQRVLHLSGRAWKKCCQTSSSRSISMAPFFGEEPRARQKNIWSPIP